MIVGVFGGLLVGALATAGLVQAAPEGAPLAAPMGDAFTYQGYLTDGGSPANGTYDFEFALYDDVSAGSTVGSLVVVDDAPVSEGYFTVELDFGGVFDGTALWLEIGVRPGASPGGYQQLLPRQPLTASPYALYASHVSWSGVSGMPAGFADNTDDDTTYTAGNQLSLAGTTFNVSEGAASGLDADLLDGQHGSFYRNASNLNAGTLNNARFSARSDLSAEGYLGNASGDIAQNNGTLQSNLNADRVDGQSASAFASASHNHFGQTWTGSTSPGLRLETSLSSGRAIDARATHTSGLNYGLFAESSSTSGIGAFGMSPNMGVAGVGLYGVWGQSGDTSGYGVYGFADASSGTTYGVYGESDSSSGRGVYGVASYSGLGTTYGVFGKASSNRSRGVYGETTSAEGYGGFFVNTSGVILAANNANSISDLEFRVSNDGDVFADGSFIPGGADFAELLPTQDALGPGDVVCMGSDGIVTHCSTSFDVTVVGVYSTDPGFVAGGGDMDENWDGKSPIAMLGIVPVKISAENGLIQLGDLLVSADIPGHAMRCEGVELCFGRTIGKALGGLDEGTGVIQMLVMLQ
jgi:hypothetical protein